MEGKTARPASSQKLANLVVGALVGSGIKHFVVSPGSRNAPISYELGAMERNALVHTYIRIDERDAGFTALGLAKVSGVPGVVVTTSGTAVANVFPAILEARHSGIPLLAVTADRPRELKGTGANQTTGQPGIFGDKVVASFSLGPDDVKGDAIKKCVAEIRDMTMEAPRGPAHLNIHFDEPLVPLLN